MRIKNWLRKQPKNVQGAAIVLAVGGTLFIGLLVGKENLSGPAAIVLIVTILVTGGLLELSSKDDTWRLFKNR